MKISLAIVAVALTPLALLQPPGQAPEENRTPAIVESVIVSPDELASLGFTDAEVESQRQLLESLTPAEAAAQASLSAEQALTTEELGPAPQPTFSTMAYPVPSCGSSSYYRVTQATGAQYCYATAGNVSVNIPNVRYVRPGAYWGRIFYYHSNNYFYSVWRNGYLSYDFSPLWMYGSVTALQVQLRTSDPR